MEPLAWSWRIVLVRPRNPLNIGAAARAMANFGFRHLVVVNPFEPTWQETRSAVGAEEVVRSARAVATLADGIGEAQVVIGTTSGSRRHLTRELIALGDLRAWLEANRRQQVSGKCGSNRSPRARTQPAALLFGSEKTGLSNDEMSYCHGLVRIPTAPECPSMNLGQSVAVCCYELAREGLLSSRALGVRLHRSDLASIQSLEHLLARAARVLDEAGYLQPKVRQARLLKLRQLLLEMRLTNYDARVFGGVLAQVEWKLRHPDRQ